MPKCHSTGSVPAFLLSKPVSSIRPTIIRGQLCFAVADVAFTSFRQAACAWSAAESHRLDVADYQPPLRRCDDCRLNLGRDVLRSLGSCPRWGMCRAGVESHCPAFVAKTVGVTSHG